MTKMMDIQCNVEFPSDEAYVKHKKSGHALFLDQAVPLESLPVPTPPPNLDTPSSEFMEMVNRIESKTPQPRASQHPSELPPSTPIKLTYKYLGECSDHRVPVDTLELDINKLHFCIAFCPSGKHQVETKEVAKL